MRGSGSNDNSISSPTVGLAELSNPSQRSCGLFRLWRSDQPAQPRFICRPQRHCLNHAVSPSRVVYSFNRLHTVEAPEARATTVLTMVFGQGWYANQYYRVDFPGTLLPFLLLSGLKTSAARHYELECRHVLGNHDLRDGLLRRVREEVLHPSCEARQARCLSGPTATANITCSKESGV